MSRTKEEPTSRDFCPPPRKRRLNPTLGASSSSETTSQAVRPTSIASFHRPRSSRQPRRSARIAQQARGSTTQSPSPEVIDLVTPPRASPGALLEHPSALPSYQSSSTAGPLYIPPSASVIQSTGGSYHGPPPLNTTPALNSGPPPLRETVIRSATRHPRGHRPQLPSSQIASDFLGTLGREDDAYLGIPTLTLSSAQPSAITQSSFTQYRTPMEVSPPFPLQFGSIASEHSPTRAHGPSRPHYSHFPMDEMPRNWYSPIPPPMPTFDELLPVHHLSRPEETRRSSRTIIGSPNSRAMPRGSRGESSSGIGLAEHIRPPRRPVRTTGSSSNSGRGARASVNIDWALSTPTEVPGRPAARRDVELIVVDDSDSDDDVIIESYEPGPQPAPVEVDQDEVFARELQATFDDEEERRRMAMSPPAFPYQLAPYHPGMLPGRYGHAGPSIGRPSTSHEDTDRDVGLIRDNFDALASRVNSWTRQDATRFLNLATRPGTRPPRSRRHLAQSMHRMPANLLIRAIVGDTAVRLSYEELLELAENIGPARPQGVSKATLDKLPVTIFTKSAENAEQRCVICMCGYEEKDKLRSLPCSHDFHRDCIDQWFRDHNTCPICRVQIKAQ